MLSGFGLGVMRRAGGGGGHAGFVLSEGTLTASGYSGDPWGLFVGNNSLKHTFSDAGVLAQQDHLFRSQTKSATISLPDGQGGDTGEGFTCTGLAWDGGAFWVGNDGGNVSGDTSRRPSVVRVSQAGAKLSEIDMGTLYTNTASVQGVAYDTSDATLWVATSITAFVRHLTVDGVDIGDGFALAGVNGLAYDSLRDKLWTQEISGNVIYIRDKDGILVNSFTGPDASDQLFYDAERDYIWVTYGLNGEAGRANAYKASDFSLVGTVTFPDATAIEGMVIVDGDFYVAHDGYYHEPDGAVIAKNVIQAYPAVAGGVNVAWAEDHDPSSPYASRGFLFEPEYVRGNSFPIGVATATQSNVTVAVDTTVAPTGLQTAETVTATAGSSIHALNRSESVTALAGEKRVSITVVKKGTHDYLWTGDRGDAGNIHSATFNIATGSVIGTTNCTAQVVDYGDGWFGLVRTFTRVNGGTVGANVVFAGASHTADHPTITAAGTETFILFAHNGGIGSMPTSLMLDNAESTRTADTPTVATSTVQFSNASNTFKFTGRTARGSGSQVLFQIDDGTEDNRFRIERNASNEVRFIVTVGGVAQCDLNLGTVANDTAFRVAIRAQADDFAGSLNGAAIVTNSSGSVPTVTTVRMGHSATGEQWTGTVSHAEVAAVIDDAALVAWAS